MSTRTEDDEKLLISSALEYAKKMPTGRVFVDCEGCHRDVSCMADITRLNRLKELWKEHGKISVTLLHPSALVMAILRTLDLANATV